MKKSPTPAIPLPTLEALLHELRAHQVDLEMVNESLRQSQLALEESRDRLAQFHDFAPVGYLELAQAGQIIEANFSAAAMLGLPRGQLLQRCFAGFIPPTGQDLWHVQFRRTLVEGGTREFELDLEGADGRQRGVHAICRRKETLDVPPTLLLTLTDLSERKRIEQARETSELRLQLALEATGDGLWDWDIRSNHIYLSPGYYALTGYRPEAVTSNFEFFQSLVHPQDWAGVTALMDAHLRGETMASIIEFRMLTASGAVRWIRGRGRVVERGAGGEPLRMAGHITDISERKRIEQALQLSEARYRQVVEDQTEVIGRVRADGTILFANEVYCRFFGRRLEELIGSRWQPIAHPDDLPMIEARLAELTPEHPVVVIENRVRIASGEMLWMQFVNRAFFDDSGHITEIQAVGRDINERKQIEARKEALLDENTRLGRALIDLQEQERAHLARELHDELSQQLVAIRAHAGAIRRRAMGVNGGIQADAEAIEASASHIYNASHRLMEGLHPRLLDSADLVDVLLAQLLCWSRSHPDIEPRLRLSSLSREVDSEVRIHLFRIVQECLANVARHAQAGRVRVFLGEATRGNGYVIRLVVRDNGLGLDPDTPRSGYGLIAMRERARSLGGVFQLQSRPGGGTRIAVEIPL